MAVVQADTDFSSGGEPFSGGEYGSEALAQFLGEDWLNMANQSISHDGQYVPYNQDEVSCILTETHVLCLERQKHGSDEHGNADGYE